MGKLYWKRGRHTSHSRDSYIDISNWKAIRFGALNNQIEGCTIVIRNLSKPFGVDTFFVPGIADIKHLIMISNTPDINLETFFIETAERTTRCDPCKGVGKFDWTNKVTNSRIHDYIRDPNYIIVYEPNYKAPSFDNSIYRAPYLVLSRCKIDESNGETLCEKCLGTGMLLDGRHSTFLGFNNFKINLKVIGWE